MFVKVANKTETTQAERLAVDHVAQLTNADAGEGSSCELSGVTFGMGNAKTYGIAVMN